MSTDKYKAKENHSHTHSLSFSLSLSLSNFLAMEKENPVTYYNINECGEKKMSVTGRQIPYLVFGSRYNYTFTQLYF
jgi:hypothetical protein